jgi:predicted transcriptional regulator
VTASKQVHQLIDRLPTEDLEAIAYFLERLEAEQDPVERAFLRAALLEPEELSPEDEESIREAEADVAAGRLISHEDIRREFLDES